MAQDRAILFYVKYPEIGRVKTRLAKDLGEQRTLELYGCFVKDLLSMLVSRDVDIRICYSGGDEAGMKKFCDADVYYEPQDGADLGERMRKSFESAFSAGYQQILIIGSDSPDLDGAILDKAFEYLDEEDKTAVIGPAVDGGYYLLGFSKESFTTLVFEGVEWSTETVYEVTDEKLRGAGRQVKTIERWHDVDTINDLVALFNRNLGTAFSDSLTMSYLIDNEIVPKE